MNYILGRSTFTRIFRTSLMSILLICTCPVAQIQASEVTSLHNSDQACGPRCLWAFMKTVGIGKRDCGIECIYGLIGKSSSSPTNLKDLSLAASKLGFRATGFKTTFGNLAKMKGYAILPVGNTKGTAKDPLHFVLVKLEAKDDMVVIDTHSLQKKKLSMSELKKSWNGYALFITVGKKAKLVSKANKVIESNSTKTKVKKYVGIKNFGHVDAGSVLNHVFEVCPDPRKKIVAKIVGKSCSCITPVVERRANGDIILKMELKVEKPGWQSVYVALALGANKTIKHYKIRAYGKNSFQLRPEIAYLEAPNGGIVKYPVEIEYFATSDAIVEFSHFKSKIKNLKIGPVQSRKEIEGELAKFVFEVPILLDAGPTPNNVRSISGKVEFVLKTSNGDRVLPLKLSAVIGQDRFKLSPERVFLLASKSSSTKISRVVELEFETQVKPSNIEVKVNGDLPITAMITKKDKGCFSISIDVQQEKVLKYHTGLHKDNILIVPKGDSGISKIILPVSVFIKE